MPEAVRSDELGSSQGAGYLECPTLMEPVRGPRDFLWPAILALGFAALADWLFWDHPRGWTVGAYGALLLVVLLAWEARQAGRPSVLVLAGATLALMAQCVEEPGRLTVALAVIGLFTLAVTLRVGWAANAVEWFRRWGLVAALGVLTVYRDTREWQRAQRVHGGVVRPTGRLFGRWSIPALLAIGFLALFAVANPLISTCLADAWHTVRRFCEQLVERVPSGFRILMWVIVGVSVWALLRFRLSQKPGGSSGTPAAGGAWPGAPSPAFVVRCLFIFNALFAVQTALDLRYLWGGAELPHGLTYASYAHRGAYPLMAAAILAAVFVLATFQQGAHERPMRWARRLVYLWLGQNLLLVVSAAWRLRLYVDVYSLTRLRVAAAIWMLLVLCGLAWIVVKLVARRSNTWLLNVNVATAVAVAYACAFVDFDDRIATFNVEHCREVCGAGEPIDVAYLEDLGPEALPALAQLVDRAADPVVRTRAAAEEARLRADVDADLASWRGWTWRRQRLASGLNGVRSVEVQELRARSGSPGPCAAAP